MQFLFPIGSDSSIREEDVFRLKVQVRPPYGADQLVAITASRRLPELEKAIRGLDKRRTPMMISELVNQIATTDILVGSASLITAP